MQERALLFHAFAIGSQCADHVLLSVLRNSTVFETEFAHNVVTIVSKLFRFDY